MKKNASYTPEKVSVRQYIGIFKGIRLPWLFFVLYFAASIASMLASLKITYFTGDAVDAQGNVPVGQLAGFALGYIVVGLCSTAMYIFQGVASERINLALRKKLWRKIIHTRQSAYDIDGGETLVSRVTTDCDYASQLFMVIIALLSMLFTFITYITQMYSLSVKLSNYMLLLIPLSAVIGWGYARLQYLFAQKKQAMLSNATTYLIEHTHYLPLIKISNSQEQEIGAGREHFQQQYVMQIKVGLMSALMSAMQTLYTIICILIPFAVGAGLVAAGKMTAGEVVAFYSISTSVGTAFTNIIDYAGQVKQANGALARVTSTMALEDEPGDGGAQMDEPDADIVFENVSFGYSDGDVLKDINCRIPKNKVTAVIGANGSGKSTMFRLMDRLYDPHRGIMRFGTRDAAEYDLKAWRRTFGVVAQDSPLMEGTIRGNICYGCERDISDSELMAVAQKTHVYDFVSQLPQGFDTPVAAGGQNFSGGQRQLIAIARAMMSSPDYLLLDEATSNLDARSERLVMNALEELMKGRTTVIIAHSMRTIRNADHVIVLKNGEVETSGSPAEVLAASDSYLKKIMDRRSAMA